ncbi:MAG: phosphate regulon sensor histidine kinase PhoR [Sideroxydans sp.]
MSDFWQRALVYPLTLLLFSLLLWPLAGALPAALLFGAGILWRGISHLRNLAALQRWLNDAENLPVPEGFGIWEDTFAHLNRLMRALREERERRAAALLQMQQATSALPEGVVILDEADRIEWCNALAEQHFGLDAERDLGQQITYLARQPEFVEYLAMRDYAEPLLLRNARQEGLVLSVKLIAYGQRQRLLISRDVTQLERIETMRRDFVGNVSHELRTPLTVVNGFVETLLDMPTLDNEAARRGLQLMAEQTRRMENLVQDLLTLSRLESDQNPVREETVDVAQLVSDIERDGRLLSREQHRITSQVERTLRLRGSADELRSAFGNLLTNAIRYTPAGGEIVLRWALRDGQPVFSVQDNGIGIAPQHIPRLTERFYRVDRSRSRETGGTGLGLAIVKHVALRHQASLDIHSEEGKGSTFSLVFPARRSITEPDA